MKPHSYAPYLEISLDSLLHNLAQLRRRLPAGTGIMAVVKDNAYGCGSAMVARTLETRGKVGFFAVNSPQEAFYLCKKGVRSPVLVLGEASAAELRAGEKKNIIFTLNENYNVDRWNSSGATVRFHVAIDTRMHRLGISPDEIALLAEKLRHAPRLVLEGAFTHFADADKPGTPTVGGQMRVFNDALARLQRAGLSPKHIHCANSAAIVRIKAPGCTMARPGIALYGCKPDPARKFPLSLEPVVTLKTRVVAISKVPAKTPVSYGGTYVTRQETGIATIALGYGNGYPRSLSNRGEVLIRGRRYRIAGNVTMDYCMVDAGPEPSIAEGDEVVAIGRQGAQRISPDDIALIDGTIGYEILCNLSASLDRVYIYNGKIIGREKGRIF